MRAMLVVGFLLLLAAAVVAVVVLSRLRKERTRPVKALPAGDPREKELLADLARFTDNLLRDDARVPILTETDKERAQGLVDRYYDGRTK